MNLKRKLITLCCLIQFGFIAAFAQGFGETHLLNESWHFHLGDLKYGGAEYCDDSSWRLLDVPHDWSVESAASPSLASCTGFLPGGIAWYRKTLEIPETKKGQCVYIYFGGIYNNSEVFINGKWVGKRPNGYISFMYDLTPYINFGGRNVVAVKVDHSQDADSRWYTGSGIYRDVHLVYANPVHINLWGVHYTTKVDSKNKALLSVQTEIVNKANKKVQVKVSHKVYDASGKQVASGSYSQPVATQGLSTQQKDLSILNPILWDLKNPYLYTIKTVVSIDGQIVDQSETKIGVRTLTFDSNHGFALNGHSMKIKGVCIHHDAGCLGSAVPRDVWRRRLLQLKEIGCNAIRLSHNPQAECVYDLCDELGILVKDEAFDEWEYPKKKWIVGWNVGKPGFQGSASYFREWGKRDLTDMIRRDRNHPSIIMWSIGNEVDYPNDPYSHPILNSEEIGQKHVKGYLKSQPRAERLGDIAKELVAEAKKQDLSRPVTAALAGAVMSNETDYPGALDIVGYNYTENRYEQDHAKYPNRVLYGSETRHDMKAWKAVRDNEYIFGQFIWTGFDYLGEAGPWPSRGFTTGMIDLAGNIKPDGYYRRALWLESPTAYIGTYKINDRNKNKVSTNATATWNYEMSEMIRVVTYTNCEEAELYLNDKQVGVRKPYDDQTGIIFWDVPYVAGTLEIRGYNKGELAVTEMIQSSGLSYSIEASLDRTTNIKAKDCLHLQIRILDKEGRFVPLADNQITCKLSGQAKLLGLESGESNAADNYRDAIQRCKNGKLLGYIQPTADSGEISIYLTSPLLQSKKIVLKY
ncbi:MAG: sugar-binding domain-containing protein [Bacteroidaceae bacterium]